MASSQSNGLRTPFQDLTNTANSDPKELKRLRERVRYALNRDEILKRRREARDHKKATSALLNTKQTPSNTPVAISPGLHTAEMATVQSVVTQLQCTPATEGIPAVVVQSGATPFYGPNSLKSNWRASSNKENVNTDDSGIESSHGSGLRTPLQALNCSRNLDKEALKRQRENARYEQNKEGILKKLREICHQKKATAALKNGEHTPSGTPVSSIFSTGLNTKVMATNESAVIQLQHTPTVEAMTTIGLQSCASPLQRPNECSSCVNETMNVDEDSDWLHRNNTYQMQEIGGRMRPVNIPSATSYGDTHVGKYIGNDQCEDAYGIYEPDGNTRNIDECLEATNHGETGYVEPDEEARIFTEQVVDFESYRVEQHPADGIPTDDT